MCRSLTLESPRGTTTHGVSAAPRVFVAIRITTTTTDRQTILKVDGRLRADDVEELSRAYRSVIGATSLDLSDLQSADRDGAAILRELVSLGVEVRAATPYIELLLRTKS
jgi:ABC-type transporter Mla MlaB component